MSFDQITEGWERSETNSGVPYYVNHRTERTSWDHPYLIKVLEELDGFDEIKYAAYRTSVKIRHLQRQLHLHHVELTTIRRVFEQAGHSEGSWEVIRCDELLQILIGIFHASPSSFRATDEPHTLADLLLNLLLNMFDMKRTGCIGVISAKMTLATLSSARLAEKYRFYYQELHDPSTYISRRVLATFLQNMIQLPELLHESSAFGRNVDPAVNSCCQMGHSSGGVSEDVFYRWLQKEPQTLVWLPTFHRVAATETVKHEAKCNICKDYPIIGFRYRCLKCFNFDLCQHCFFTGKTSKRHKLKHPIQEYCLASTTKDDASAFMKTLRNNLGRRQKDKTKKKYLPIEADNQDPDKKWKSPDDLAEPDIHTEISETARRLADIESSLSVYTDQFRSPPRSPLHSPTILTASPIPHHKENISPISDGLGRQRAELEAIILQLEEENRSLYQELCRIKETSDTESNLSSEKPVALPVKRLSPMKRSPLSDQTNRLASHLQHVQSLFKDDENLLRKNRLIKEPESLYLSVPIIKPLDFSQYSSGSSPYKPVEVSSGVVEFPRVSSPDNSPLSPSEGYRQVGLRTLGDSLNDLDDLDVSPSHFSLPSPSKSHDFCDEEAELEALVDQMDQLFPSDLSFSSSAVSTGPTLQPEEDEMLRAANTVGTAMSEFVSKAVHVRGNY